MALFHDGPLNDAADLQRYENDILNVASVEGIDLGVKIFLAQEQVANDLVLFRLRRSSLREPWLGLQGVREVRDVVVTPPLQQWHVYKTLALVYRDAYSNQLNDRYQGKWQEYEKLAKAGERTYFQIGVGLVADPVPKAPAPTLTNITGPGSGGSYYVAVTWVNAAGQEGAPSELGEFSTTDGQELVVAAGTPPQNVIGWNVYVGLTPTTLTLQNTPPLTIGDTWKMTTGPNPGTPLPEGQRPTWFLVDHRAIERG